MLQLKSLQQRFALYILLPVTVLLLCMGLIGFVSARNSLLEQWGEASILKLQRAAHHIDMKLSPPKEWFKVFHETSRKPYAKEIQADIVRQLESMEGVARVKLVSQKKQTDIRDDSGSRTNSRDTRNPHPSKPMHRMMAFHHEKVEVMPPIYDSQIDNQTVSIISEIENSNRAEECRLEVFIRFDYLMDTIGQSGWWQSNKTFLVDDTGKILTSTLSGKRQHLGDNLDPLESATLSAMKTKSYGTIFGKGLPPSEVSGFYRLKEAPWTLVMFAPGNKILSSIIRFRWYYLATSTIFILFILVLIRLVTGHTIAAIKNVSMAAVKVARGEFDVYIPRRTHDEVGELVRSFNAMVGHLEERGRLKKALSLAMEIQQNLLPKKDPEIPGLDIAGKSIYCDETGGDYFDFIQDKTAKQGEINIMVGDVSGHGIPSALLMTTARALLRQRVSLPGSHTEVIADVNRQLTRDVEDSGRFITLFYLKIDISAKSICWVRAGHDPAFIFNPHSDSFTDLLGKGLPLGIFKDAEYENPTCKLLPGQIIVIGTDGIWESRNPEGKMFGKAAFRQLIRMHADKSAKEIVETAVAELDTFRHPGEQEDDITLVVIKVDNQ